MDWRVWVYLVAVAALLLLYGGYRWFTHTWDIRKLWLGEDGRPSTSKFQFALWFAVIFGAYVAVLAARVAVTGNLDALPQLDGSLLLALGFSGTTVVGAKHVATAIDQRVRAQGVVPRRASRKDPGGLATKNDGAPDLGKIELLGWTLVGVAVFIFVLVQRIAAGGPNIQLPAIDQTLLLLMGIGQATYLGQKVAGSSATVAKTVAAAGQHLAGAPVAPSPIPVPAPPQLANLGQAAVDKAAGNGASDPQTDDPL